VATATQYAYKVKDTRGRLVEGKVEAETEAAVADRLRSMGYRPLEIRAAAQGLEREIKLRKDRVKLKDLAIFSRQFATMINAGLSMLRTLTILSEQSENPELNRVLRLVKADVEAGNALSVAFAKYPRVFPPLMVSMVRAGETGGFLVLAVLMVCAMLLFVVPQFDNLFHQLGGTLPLPTRILVAASHGMKFLAPLGAVGSVAALVAWRRYGTNPAVRDVVDPLKLKAPVFGKLFQKVALARFARTLGTLLRAGVPILSALDITADTCGNVVIGRALRDVAESVKTGESISGPLRKHPIFPSMVVHMMASGEETGALDEMLNKIGEFYDNDVEATTASLTALIEPLMIAFLGTIVGSMIVALYLPMFKIFDLVQQ
jgi:type IV pilus assembly protein PilC